MPLFYLYVHVKQQGLFLDFQGAIRLDKAAEDSPFVYIFGKTWQNILTKVTASIKEVLLPKITFFILYR